MDRILIATDFSERSDRALRRATLLARQGKSALQLVHVVDDDQPNRVVETESGLARQLLEEQAATLREVDGVPCETLLMRDDPFAGIARAVAEAGPDLLVIGPHRRQALRDAFIGTTAERTIRTVHCPVLMTNAPPVGAYRTALLASDLSDASRHAAHCYAALGLATAAAQTLLHVMDEPDADVAMGHSVSPKALQDMRDAERRDGMARLAGFADSIGARSGSHLVRQAEGSAAETVLAVAQELGADLLVVGMRGRGGLAKMLLGSVAEAVLRRAPLDVLVIPPAERAAEGAKT